MTLPLLGGAWPEGPAAPPAPGVHTSLSLYIYIYIYIYICMYVCMYVCMYIYIYIYTQCDIL